MCRNGPVLFSAGIISADCDPFWCFYNVIEFWFVKPKWLAFYTECCGPVHVVHIFTDYTPRSDPYLAAMSARICEPSSCDSSKPSKCRFRVSMMHVTDLRGSRRRLQSWPSSGPSLPLRQTRSMWKSRVSTFAGQTLKSSTLFTGSRSGFHGSSGWHGQDVDGLE